MKDEASKRKIVSATIAVPALEWLNDFSEETQIPKSRLIEEGITLLKRESEKEAFLAQQINEGIDAMLSQGEDQAQLADPLGDFRIGNEFV